MNGIHGDAVPPVEHTKRRRLLGIFGSIAVGSIVAFIWILVHGANEARRGGTQPTQGLEADSKAAARALPHAGEQREGDPSESRTDAAVDLTPAPEIEGTEGILQFITPGTLAPAAGSRWALVGDGESATAVADVTGRAPVPAGTWRLISLDAEWVAPAAPVVVDTGSEQVLWIERAVTRRFRVTGPTGAPIEGVTAVWRARTHENPGAADNAVGPVTRTSDASGIVVFVSGAFENGIATFLHSEHARVRTSLCGTPEEEVEIQMRPAGPRRSLHFVPSRSEMSLDSVVLSSADGLELARSGTQPNIVEVPDWVPPNETLRVSAPGIYPCQFRLADLPTERVVLPASIPVAVRAEDHSGCGLGISVVFRATEASTPDALEPLVGSAARTCQPGDEIHFELPDGYELEAQATNACGSMDAVRFSVGNAEVPIQLVLRVPDQLEIAVRDDGGRILSIASARVVGLGTFQADAGGIARVPLRRTTRTIHVSAPGYSSVVLSRAEPEDGSIADDARLTVTLAKSGRSAVRVLSTAGRPLAGMRVRVWPPRSMDAFAGSGPWSTGSVSVAVVGTTNGQGLCSLTGIRTGVARIEVDLPPLLGTDAWQRSAYPPTRFENRLGDGLEVAVEVPEPAPLTLEVLDGATGRPVPGFTLLGQAATVPPVEVSGGYWQGWVSSAVTQFTVVVEGLGSTSISIDHASRGEAHVVRVGLDRATTLRITGLSDPVEGTPVSVQVLDETPEGLHLVASLEATLDEHGEALLDLGPWQGARIAVAPMDRHKARLEFEPEAQPVMAGGVVQFRAVSGRD